MECKDESVKMSIGRHSRYYEDSKDSEVMEEIIRRYSGLSSDVDPTSLVHRELVQHHCTDWDFVLSRAEVNGRLLIVDDGKVQIKKPNTKAGSSASGYLRQDSARIRGGDGCADPVEIGGGQSMGLHESSHVRA